MREIKFRAWDKSDEMMYYDIIYGIEFEDGSKYDFCNFIGTKDPDDYHKWVSMQYTGLKDKNGKEIYEGDIVRETDEYCSTDPEFVPEVLGTYVIKYDGNGFWPNDRDANEYGFNTDGYGSYFEVIGNIYENPELLKNGQ